MSDATQQTEILYVGGFWQPVTGQHALFRARPNFEALADLHQEGGT